MRMHLKTVRGNHAEGISSLPWAFIRTSGLSPAGPFFRDFAGNMFWSSGRGAVGKNLIGQLSRQLRQVIEARRVAAAARGGRAQLDDHVLHL